MTPGEQAEKPSAVPSPGVASARHEETPELRRVLGDLWQHSETLVRQELALAKAEYEVRLAQGKAAVRRAGIAAGLFHAAYLSTLATIVLVLAQWLEPWLASLVVAIGASAGAFTFAWAGKQAAENAVAPLEKDAGPSNIQHRHNHSVGRQRAHT
jgi:hypothetical protein